jgi:hypothetical protein
MTPANVYLIYKIHPHAKGHIEKTLLGKFALENGTFEILEDHGLPKDLASKPPAQAARLLHRFTNSMYYDVINMQDLMNGLHPDYIKDHDTKQAIDDEMKAAVTRGGPETPASDFEFDRIGGEGPRKLSVSDGQVFMDGHLLSQDEIDLVQGHVKGGKAFLRRMAKAESIFNPGMDPKILEEDHSIPGVGNLRAYNNFMSAAPPGLHVHVNLHDTGHLNHTYGHEIGHRAIQATGKALHHVARSLIGRDARVFRLGGDKFAVHVPSTEGAALLARGLRQHLESIPPVNGTHNLTVSMGVGPSKEHAEWALHDANGEKNRRGYKPGQARTHVAMRIPGGLEGPLPVE